MQNRLTVSLLQTNPAWKDTGKNLLDIENKLLEISSETDLVLLPEMFATGFVTDPADVAETMEGMTVHWLQKMAKTKQVALAGSLPIKVANHCFNRFVFAAPSGKISFYDKRHLFAFAGEDQHYTPGAAPLAITYKGWKLAPFVCYDLRFPVWSRNTNAYDVCLYVANWPSVRIDAWNALLKARAIENTSYCIGVNRVGKDGANLMYSGHSQVLGPLGEILQKAPEEKEALVTVELRKDHLVKTRKEFPFLADRDIFQIE